ncbi:MAG: hypothetical protein ACYC0V_01445 [Armatimonadota bacterium]
MKDTFYITKIHRSVNFAVYALLFLLFAYLCYAAFFFAGIIHANNKVLLAEGYYLVKHDEKAWSICDSDNRLIIGPGVVEYAVYNEALIIGKAINYTNLSFTAPGMFMINTQSGEVISGLSKEKWETLLESRGVHDKVKFRHP